jgi:hypothetical protein
METEYVMEHISTNFSILGLSDCDFLSNFNLLSGCRVETLARS